MSIITVANLDTGETTENRVEIKQGGDDRFAVRGQKMYDVGLIKLLKTLSNNEIIRVVGMHEVTAIVGKCNILQKPFKDVTPDMNSSTRSKFKKKLIENEIIHEFGKGKIMLNPFMFLPRKDKNIKNSQYLTQQLWKYAVEDCDTYPEGLDVFQDEILPGTRKPETKYMLIKGEWYEKPIEEK